MKLNRKMMRWHLSLAAIARAAQLHRRSAAARRKDASPLCLSLLLRPRLFFPRLLLGHRLFFYPRLLFPRYLVINAV